MKFLHCRTLFILTVALTGYCTQLFGQQRGNYTISGQLKLSAAWDSVIYLSYIPTFETLYEMSDEMIISKTSLDSLGYFEFQIGFLPEEENIFRLHVTKKGDSPTTLIIGGTEENHMFLIANRYSSILLKNNLSIPPFRHMTINNSNRNDAFQLITNLVNQADSTGAESSASKRSFIEQKLQHELLLIADTSSHPLISLYALHRSKFKVTDKNGRRFYESYLKKWNKQDNLYFNEVRKSIPQEQQSIDNLWIALISGFLLAAGFVAGTYWKDRKKKSIQKLSVQERKILELLRQGASNQEISDKHNIGISTVKSHVSSILDKLNVKSRKDLMNIN